LPNLRHRTTPRAVIGVFGLVFLISFLARIANHPTAFAGGAPQIGPFDDLYHAKRIVYSAAHPARVLSFDAERGLQGAFCPWPPLYDAVAGGAARLLGGETAAGVLARAVWLPPIASSLFAGLVAAAAAWRFSGFIGFFAGAAIALSLDEILASRLGAIDHHFLEGPLLLGILGSVLFLRGGQDDFGLARRGIFFGLALTLALFVQTALLLAAAAALIAILLWEREALRPRWAGALGFALAAGALFLYRARQPAGYPDTEWYLGFPHAAALLGAAGASAFSGFLLSRGLRRREALPPAVLAGALLAAAIPGAASAILDGSRFLGGDPWLSTIIEFQPLFFGGPKAYWEGFCRTPFGT